MATASEASGSDIAYNNSTLTSTGDFSYYDDLSIEGSIDPFFGADETQSEADEEDETDSEDEMIRNMTKQDEGFETESPVDTDNHNSTPKTDRFGFIGGQQYTHTDSGMSKAVIRARELKWLDMLDEWPKWKAKKMKKVKLRCRKGIPSSIRSKAWELMAGRRKNMEHCTEVFTDLEKQPGDPKWLDIIEKDLHRQFPFHEIFAEKGGYGQQDLYRLLKAYTIYRPEEGYCQAQAPVAAVLLMHMPLQQAFWCFVAICEFYLPGYYSAGLEAIQIDGKVFHILLKKTCPLAYKIVKKHKIEPMLYVTEWFMCCFARTLPWTSVLRVWDMFLCEGLKVLFRVAIVLVKNTLGQPHTAVKCVGLYEALEQLKNIPDHVMEENFLVNEISKLKLKDKEIDHVHRQLVHKRRAQAEKELKTAKANKEKLSKIARETREKEMKRSETMRREEKKTAKRRSKNMDDSVSQCTGSVSSFQDGVIGGSIASSASIRERSVSPGKKLSSTNKQQGKIRKDVIRKDPSLTLGVVTSSSSAATDSGSDFGHDEMSINSLTGTKSKNKKIQVGKQSQKVITMQPKSQNKDDRPKTGDNKSSKSKHGHSSNTSPPPPPLFEHNGPTMGGLSDYEDGWLNSHSPTEEDPSRTPTPSEHHRYVNNRTPTPATMNPPLSTSHPRANSNPHSTYL